MTRVGLYARVSTADQNGEAQLARLREWAKMQGYEIALEHCETASGRLVRRPQQDEIMRAARGRHIDEVAVCKVDRWGRNMRHLANSVQELRDLGVGFHAIDQGIHTGKNNAMGDLVLHIMGSIAQMEAELISERTKDALAHRKAQGKKLGRPFKPCAVCGAARRRAVYGKVSGERQPLCSVCKVKRPATGKGGGKVGGSTNGMPGRQEGEAHV